MNLKLILTSILLCLISYTIASPIKFQILLHTESEVMVGQWGIIEFEQELTKEPIRFWRNKSKVEVDSIEFNKMATHIFIDPNAKLKFSIQATIKLDNVQILFYNMNETNTLERSKYVILNEEDIKSLFELKQEKKGSQVYTCKISLQDLFNYQSYREPYLQNKDMASFQMILSPDISFEGGILLSVFDTLNNAYNIYKYVDILSSDEKIYNFEFNKLGKNFDIIKLVIDPNSKEHKLVKIENMSLTNNSKTRDINSFALIEKNNSSSSVSKSFPIELGDINIEEEKSVYLLKVKDFGISYSRTVTLGYATMLIVTSIFFFLFNSFYMRTKYN